MKAILFFIMVLCFSFQGYGMIVGKVKIEGTVVKYDKKTVTLKNDKGKKIKVRRQAIPSHFKLRSGVKVHALLSPNIITKRLNSDQKSQ